MAAVEKNSNYEKWKESQAHWDDEEYLRSLSALMKFRYKRLDERVLALIQGHFKDAPAPPLLLDAGCGRAEFAAFLGESFKDGSWPLRYLGVEPSPEQIGHRIVQNPGLGILGGAAENLPLCDMSVDAVLMKEILDHCYDPAKVFREAYRVLRPGGLLVVTLTNDRSWFKRLLPMVNRSLKAKQTDHLHFFGPGDLVKLAQAVKFDRVSTQTYNYLKLPGILEGALGALGKGFSSSLLQVTDAMGQSLLPGLGGGMTLTAQRPKS